jgi:hypothetical protein
MREQREIKEREEGERKRLRWGESSAVKETET